jgi:hypothetical protein
MATDDPWKALEIIGDWVRFADAKAGAVLASSGILAGLTIQRLPAALASRSAALQVACLAATVLALSGSAFAALMVLIPRTRTTSPTSLLHFADIARKYRGRRSHFADDFHRMLVDESALTSQIADQVWAMSLVATRKFRYMSMAIRLLGTGLITAALASLLAVK